MRSCKDIHMPTIAIISQKGGAGKTTLALHLAAAAEDSGHTALVIDVDPQATASQWAAWRQDVPPVVIDSAPRSEEHTSELQSLMRISYAVFCLKKKKIQPYPHYQPATCI